jgi:hypothetical protein
MDDTLNGLLYLRIFLVTQYEWFAIPRNSCLLLCNCNDSVAKKCLVVQIDGS